MFQNSPEVDDEGYSIRPDDESEADILPNLTDPSQTPIHLGVTAKTMCVNQQTVCEKTQRTEMEIKSRKMSHPCTSRRLQRSPPLKIIASIPRVHFSKVMMCFILLQYFFMMVELPSSVHSQVSQYLHQHFPVLEVTE